MDNEIGILENQKQNIKMAYAFGSIDGNEAFKLYQEINEKIIQLLNSNIQE